MKIKKITQNMQNQKETNIEEKDKYTVRSMINDLKKWENYLKLIK